MYKLLLLATCITAAFATTQNSAQPSACLNQKSTDNPNQIIKTVEVGGPNGTLKYIPDNVSFLDEDATKEWFVVFKFNPKNHTVTESPFAEPCVPLAKSKAVAANASLISDAHPGIKSGFVPVNGTEPFIRTFTVKVNDTKPIWIFCGQPGHCQKGMVMVINQAKTGNKTIDAFRGLAANFDANAQNGAAPSASGASAPAVTPAPTATGANSAGGLSPSSSASSSSPASLVSVLSGNVAAPTQRPVRLAALGGLAVAGAVALL